ncbi:MAG: thrombospondin type 3 repeat-containing protein, partial [Caldilineaceae bacterium]|nr:thrombospondin type 3 repeat-containing protein [Caldilineaceae bacterium]
MNVHRRFLVRYLSVLIALAIAATLPAIAWASPTCQANTPTGLVLWNRLGSQREIETSEVGLNGTFLGGRFVPGMFGNAYSVNYNENELLRFPKEVIPIEEGTIEFWARLTDIPVQLRWGENPSLIKATDSIGTNFGVHLNGNDGAANGGLCGRAGFRYTSGTGTYGTWTYEQVLGVGQAEAWHHYALVWRKDGIPGVDNGTRRITVFLDGQANSGKWYTGPSPEFVPLVSGELVFNFNQNLTQGTIAFDNLKIWNYAKTNFADRFTEDAGFTSSPQDIDNDGIVNEADNCVEVFNPIQEDTDGDNVGDACDADDDADGAEDTIDNCPLIYNPTQDDTDSDGLGNLCDSDDDNDGIADTIDNCLVIFNPAQGDIDSDGFGDFCDSDDDNDGAEDTIDNCPR